MIIRFARNMALAALAGCGFFLGSCSDEDVLPADPGMVTLRMHIHTGLESASRAGADNPDGDDPAGVADTPSAQKPDDWSKPVGDFEKISTIRVIILRNVSENDRHGRVEANTIVAASGPLYGADMLEFKVLTGNKRVYIIANEDALPVPAAVQSRFETARKYLGSISVNDSINADVFHNWIASAESNSLGNISRAIFSNSENVGLPLTEYFNMAVTVDSPIEKEVEEDIKESKTVDAHMFLTRCPAKADFTLKVAKDYQGKGSTITGIRLNGLDWEQYVFPRSATYNPAKRVTDGPEYDNDPASGGYVTVQRYITSFAAPTGRQGGARYQLTGLSIPITSGTTTTSAPIYIPESLMTQAGQNYEVQIQIDNNPTWFTAQPLTTNILKVNGMAAIARNSYLRIEISLTNAGITWNSIVAPYNVVDLKPEFGL